MTATDKLIDQLAELALGLDSASVSEKSRDRVKTILLHDFSIGLSSLRDPPYLAAVNVTRRLNVSRQGRFTLIGAGRTDSQEEAVFLNAMLMSAKAQEDFYGALHLGPIVISAALAAAEAVDASGPEFLTAVRAGYETGLTMYEICGAYTAKRGLRGTPLFGQVGAASAVGKLLGLSLEQLKSALSHALANVSGTAESLLAGTTEWHFQAAWAARKALWAAHLAAAGMSGSPHALSGPAGFVQAFGGPDHIHEVPLPPPDRLQEVGLKRYPVNIFVMSPLEGALRIARSLLPEARSLITEVIVQVNPNEAAGPLFAAAGPFDPPARGILSAAYCVAAALLKAEFTRTMLDEMSQERPTIEAAQKVKIEPSQRLSPLTACVTVRAGRSEYREEIVDTTALYFTNFDGERARLQTDLQAIATDGRVPGFLSPVIAELDARGSRLNHLSGVLAEIKR